MPVFAPSDKSENGTLKRVDSGYVLDLKKEDRTQLQTTMLINLLAHDTYVWVSHLRNVLALRRKKEKMQNNVDNENLILVKLLLLGNM